MRRSTIVATFCFAASAGGLVMFSGCSPTSGGEGSARPSASASGERAASARRPGGNEDPTDQLTGCAARAIARDLEPAKWVGLVTKELDATKDDAFAKSALGALTTNLPAIKRSDALGLSLAYVARTTLRRGDRAGAVQLAERAESIVSRPDPDVALDRDEALDVVATVYATAGEHERATKVAADRGRTLANVAIAYTRAGDTARADKILAPLVRRSGRAPSDGLALVEALSVRGRLVEARGQADRMGPFRALALSRIVELAPDSTPKAELLTLAEIALDAADLPGEDWDRRARVYLAVARRFGRLGEKPRAKALRDRLTDLARVDTPNLHSSDVLATIATDLADEGDVAGALNTLDSFRRAPLAAVAPGPLARVVVLTRAGRFADATSTAREVVSGLGYATLLIASRSDARHKDPELYGEVAALACPL